MVAALQALLVHTPESVGHGTFGRVSSVCYILKDTSLLAMYTHKQNAVGLVITLLATCPDLLKADLGHELIPLGQALLFSLAGRSAASMFGLRGGARLRGGLRVSGRSRFMDILDTLRCGRLLYRCHTWMRYQMAARMR